ncbi:MAG: hypothetical protein QOE45_819 [Frankiaceae bacterium]|nr:hypothetical protein [Frankiaceae bacterium]
MTPEVPERQRDVAKYVVIALALIVFGVGLFVVLLPSKTPDISFRTVAVQLGDPKQVVVTFEVTKAPLASAECQVTATGESREIVNRLTGIRIGPSPDQRTTTHTVTVPTDQRATAAAVATCVITRTR